LTVAEKSRRISESVFTSAPSAGLDAASLVCADNGWKINSIISVNMVAAIFIVLFSPWFGRADITVYEAGWGQVK
jgi:hypothetical protein